MMMMMMMTMDGCVVENEKVKYFQNISFWTIKILPGTRCAPIY